MSHYDDFLHIKDWCALMQTKHGGQIDKIKIKSILHDRQPVRIISNTRWKINVSVWDFSVERNSYFFPDTFKLVWAFTLTSSRQRSYCFLWLSFSIDSAEFSAWADKTQTDKLRELLQLLLKEMQRYLKGSCLPAAPEDLQLHWRTWSCFFFS